MFAKAKHTRSSIVDCRLSIPFRIESHRLFRQGRTKSALPRQLVAKTWQATSIRYINRDTFARILGHRENVPELVSFRLFPLQLWNCNLIAHEVASLHDCEAVICFDFHFHHLSGESHWKVIDDLPLEINLKFKWKIEDYYCSTYFWIEFHELDFYTISILI